MPTQRLTNKAVENAKPPVKGRRMVWDSVISDDAALSGSFGFRVTERGVKSWVTMYRLEDKRNPGKKIQRFQTLGHFPATPLAEARELAEKRKREEEERKQKAKTQAQVEREMERARERERRSRLERTVNMDEQNLVMSGYQNDV